MVADSRCTAGNGGPSKGVSDAPVEERIGGRNGYRMQYTKVECVVVKMNYFIIYCELQFCLVDVWSPAVHFANAPSQLF
jgi:hypothetical protein